jgi:hypothetical protein
MAMLIKAYLANNAVKLHGFWPELGWVTVEMRYLRIAISHSLYGSDTPSDDSIVASTHATA